jgi:hypothetical protein
MTVHVQPLAAAHRAACAAGASRFDGLTHDSNASARRLYARVARFNGFIRYDHPL